VAREVLLLGLLVQLLICDSFWGFDFEWLSQLNDCVTVNAWCWEVYYRRCRYPFFLEQIVYVYRRARQSAARTIGVETSVSARISASCENQTFKNNAPHSRRKTGALIQLSRVLLKVGKPIMRLYFHRVIYREHNSKTSLEYSIYYYTWYRSMTFVHKTNTAKNWIKPIDSIRSTWSWISCEVESLVKTPI